jgi:hypothetical protein
MPIAPGILTVADAVGSDTQEFLSKTVVRENLPVSKLEALTTVKITAVPMSKQWNRDTRGEAKRTYGITIGVEQRIDLMPQNGALTTDQLIELAESIAEWWIDEKVDLTDFSDPNGTCVVSCMSAALNVDEPFDSDLLRQQTVFRSLVGLVFKAV